MVVLVLHNQESKEVVMQSHQHPEFTELGAMQERGKAIQEDVIEIKAMLQSNFVTKAEFKPVQMVVYGLVSTFLLGILGALLALVIRQ